MSRSYLVMALVLVFSACSSPSRSQQKAEEYTDIGLTNGIDTIFVFAGVYDISLQGPGQINGPTELVRTSGEKFVVTSTTPEGRYGIEHGDTLILSEAMSYPRSCIWKPPAKWAYRYRILSSRGIALLIQKGMVSQPDRRALTTELLEEAWTHRSFPGRTDPEQPVQALIMPSAWFPGGTLEVPADWDGLTLTFVAYGPESPDRTRLRSLEPYSVVVGEQKVTGRRPAPQEQILLYPTLDLFRQSTVVGPSLYIDRASKQVRFLDASEIDREE